MTIRGQISIFLLVGLSLLLGALVFSLIINFSSDDTTQQEVTLPPDIQPIKDYVQTCFESRLRETISLAAIQGGYVGIPPRYLEYSLEGWNASFLIPYYLYDNENMTISKQRMQEEIAFGLNTHSNDCMNITYEGFDITSTGDREIDVTISNQSVTANVNAPVDIHHKDSVYSVSSFQLMVPSNIGSFHSIARDTTADQLHRGGEVSETWLLRKLQGKDIRLEKRDFYTDGHYVLIYSLTDGQATFTFGHKFARTRQDDMLSIEDIGMLNATIGYPFTHTIKYTGEDVRFSENTSLFDITSDGKIRFTPTLAQKGEHIATIQAMDSGGQTIEETFIINVKTFGEKPTISYVGLVSCEAGTPCSFRVNATSPENNSLTFTDDSPLINISSDGLVNLTTNKTGTYKFNIRVVDNEGNYAEREGTLILY